MDEEIESAWLPLRPRTSRKLFDETLRLAQKYFNFISIDEAIEMLRGGRLLKKNCCVVTFDDGQLNNLILGLPILQKYDIPVVFYVTTGTIDNPRPYWFDRLDYAIQQPGLDGLDIKIGHTEIIIDQSSRKHLANCLSMLTRNLKTKTQSDADFQREVGNISAYLEKKSGKSLDNVAQPDLWSSVMTEDDIRKCARINDVTVGSHTVNHVRLPFAEQDALVFELTESKRTIEKLIDRPCYHFCYPNGDWDTRSASAVQDAGYLSAVSTDPGCNGVENDLFSLHRYSFPPQGTPIKALFAISGFLHFISKLRVA
jgi:peptidoglycan/xylan/chitin deacetylase (PgdA/CDA1 family)